MRGVAAHPASHLVDKVLGDTLREGGGQLCVVRAGELLPVQQEVLLAPEVLEPAQQAPAHAGVAEVQVVLQGGHAARVQRSDEEVGIVEPDLVSVRNVGVQMNFKVVPFLQLPYV